MRLLLVLLLLPGLVACDAQRSAAPTPATTTALSNQQPLLDCPLADPILEDIPVPTRSSIEQPLIRARQKPYAEWNEYDRGVATKYISAHFPDLGESDVLAALFTAIPGETATRFRQWLQLRAFTPSVVTFLLRNYTSLTQDEVNQHLRDELRVAVGTPRFGDWLEVATHFDPSADLTHYALDLLITHQAPLTRHGACRYGTWCHEQLRPALTPVQAADVIRTYARQGSDVVRLFSPVEAIYATDPDGFLKEARESSVTGLVAAQLLFGAGDVPRLGQFLSDAAVPEEIRAYWTWRLAQNPPADAAPLLEELRRRLRQDSLQYEALTAPGAVTAPYGSCQERVVLLKLRQPDVPAAFQQSP
ncbi:MAG: hypothetical protein GEEBNDBF_02096 [bacterium]|nr:hypothetical protein [bacterium]